MLIKSPKKLIPNAEPQTSIKEHFIISVKIIENNKIRFHYTISYQEGVIEHQFQSDKEQLAIKQLIPDCVAELYILLVGKNLNLQHEINTTNSCTLSFTEQLDNFGKLNIGTKLLCEGGKVGRINNYGLIYSKDPMCFDATAAIDKAKDSLQKGELPSSSIDNSIKVQQIKSMLKPRPKSDAQKIHELISEVKSVDTGCTYNLGAVNQHIFSGLFKGLMKGTTDAIKGGKDRPQSNVLATNTMQGFCKGLMEASKEYESCEAKAIEKVAEDMIERKNITHEKAKETAKYILIEEIKKDNAKRNKPLFK